MGSTATVTITKPCSASTRESVAQEAGKQGKSPLTVIHDVPGALAEQDKQVTSAVQEMDSSMKGWQRQDGVGMNFGFGGDAETLEMWFQCNYVR